MRIDTIHKLKSDIYNILLSNVTDLPDDKFEELFNKIQTKIYEADEYERTNEYDNNHKRF